MKKLKGAQEIIPLSLEDFPEYNHQGHTYEHQNLFDKEENILEEIIR